MCQFQPRTSLPPTRAVVYERFVTGTCRSSPGSELASWIVAAVNLSKNSDLTLVDASADGHFNRGMA
jgi:hypothetical protein